MARSTKASRATYKKISASTQTKKKNLEIARLKKSENILKKKINELELLERKYLRYDYMISSSAIGMHNFSFMSHTLSGHGGATLGGENKYLENIIGTVVVSQQSKNKHWSGKLVCSHCDTINAPITEWTEPHHSTRVNFRLNKAFRDHSFKMRIGIFMFATTDCNVKKLLRMLLCVHVDDECSLDDGGGLTYVTYFTPTNEELYISNSYNDRFEFDVESAMICTI